MSVIRVRTGISMNYELSGEGEPLLLVIGTSCTIPLWAGLLPELAQRYQVITFDNRGLGGSERGEGEISVASLAEDASALLEALQIPKAHVLGWSLGSAITQELAIMHPEQVASTVLYATWARTDGVQRSIFAAFHCAYAHNDLEAALAVTGLAFSPQMLDRPDFADLVAPFVPAFPQNEAQMAVTREQWEADLAHDTLDRLPQIKVPSLVLVGEQDLLTPPSQSKAVADGIPGARYELFTGPGSSHALHFERLDEFVDVTTTFLKENAMSG